MQDLPEITGESALALCESVLMVMYCRRSGSRSETVGSLMGAAANVNTPVGTDLTSPGHRIEAVFQKLIDKINPATSG